MGVRLEEGLRGRTWRVGRRSGVKSWDAGDVASARGLEPLSLPLPGAQSRSCLRPTRPNPAPEPARRGTKTGRQASVPKQMPSWSEHLPQTGTALGLAAAERRRHAKWLNQ